MPLEKTIKLDKSTPALWLVLAICSATAFAQTTAVPDAQQVRNKVAERFTAADVNHDGKLTREEAETKMPMVARNFDQIDKTQRGYVTLDDIQAFSREKLARRRASKAGATN